VFSVSSGDGHLRHAYSQDDGSHVGWDDWGAPAGGSLLSKPAVGTFGAGTLHLFIRGSNGVTNGFWFRGWDAGDLPFEFYTTPFTPAGAPAMTGGSTPTAGYLASLDTSGRLWVATLTRSQGAAPSISWDWGPFPAIPGSPAPVPSGDFGIASHTPGQWDVFVTTNAGVGYQAAHSTAGDAWYNVPAPIIGGVSKPFYRPAIIAMGDMYVKLTAQLSDGSVVQRVHDFGWQNWTQVLWANGTFFSPTSSSW
jgi:hypothetical protein